MNKKGKNLTKEPPRSPKTGLGGYVILSRTIDKCRALLWGNIGEYHFDCPLDNMLFGFKGIKGKPAPKEKKRLTSLIAEHTQGWSASLASDPVEQALRSMIEAKQKRARRSTRKADAAKGGNVIDLMAVLKKNLQGGLPQRG